MFFAKRSLALVDTLSGAIGLSLYDNSEYRAKKPQKSGKDSDWKTIDAEITSKLVEISANGGKIKLVSNTILSPSEKKAIASFIEKYPTKFSDHFFLPLNNDTGAKYFISGCKHRFIYAIRP